MMVSIITPTYNSSNYIKQTIESILKQSYTNWELLITDDCSSDDTWKIIQKYSIEDSRIKVYRLEENSGAGVARNNSIKHAAGRYIAFCDSDDLWKPEKLEMQVVFMKRKQLVLTYSDYDVIDESGVFIKEIKAPFYVDYNKMIKNDYIGCLTAMYDTRKIGKKYMPLIKKRQDWALWLDILKTEKMAFNVGLNLAVYRRRVSSVSSNKIGLLRYNYELYNKIEGYSKSKSIFLVIQFLFYYLVKKILT